jgi:hypothetical protein
MHIFPTTVPKHLESKSTYIWASANFFFILKSRVAANITLSVLVIIAECTSRTVPSFLKKIITRTPNDEKRQQNRQRKREKEKENNSEKPHRKNQPFKRPYPAIKAGTHVQERFNRRRVIRMWLSCL